MFSWPLTQPVSRVSGAAPLLPCSGVSSGVRRSPVQEHPARRPHVYATRPPPCGCAGRAWRWLHHHPEVMPAGRTPPSEVNFLFACFAQCSPKNLRAEELQLFPREFHTFCQKPVPGRAATVVTGALGPGGSPSLRLPRRMSPLHRTSRSGQVNFCCVEMAKSVETTTCLKS